MLKKCLLLPAVFVLAACNQFNLPLSDFIKDATGIARVVGYSIETDHYEMSNGIIAIPPNERTVISVPVRNPQNYNLELALEGGGSAKASVEVNSDNQAAVVTIDNPVRLEEFSLTLTVTGNGRPMSADQLPRMQARYLNADLASLSITSPQSASLSPVFNPSITQYTGYVPYGTASIDIIATIPAVFASCTINGETHDSISQTVPISDGMTIPIVVTADSGMEKTYTVTVNISEVTIVLERIAITNPPDKTVYNIGEPLDITGLVVTAYYDDGTSTSIADYELSGFDSAAPGTKMVTITYQGHTTEFTVTVLQQESFPIVIPPFEDNPPDVTGITLSRSGSGGNSAETLTISNADMYDGSIEWWFGVTRLGTGPTLVLDVSDSVNLTPYNILGTQTITIEASIGDALYSVDVIFEVRE